MTDFIAEVCSNHNGSLPRALSLIDTAADIGCAGVKFQLFKIDKLYTPEALAHPDYHEMLEARRAWELPLEWLPALANRARQRGLKFGCTPFYLEAVDELLPYVDFFKIASYNLLHDDLLARVAKTGKPVVVSTGMATMEEIDRAWRVLKDNQQTTLLNCISTYPSPTNEIDLRRYGQLWYCYGHTVELGWSDHSVSPAVIYHMTIGNHFDCSMVEFHLDLDGQGVEYSIGHCWLPEQIAPVISVVNTEFTRSGIRPEDDEYLPAESESNERLWRADPGDGLRPVREMRKRLGNE